MTNIAEFDTIVKRQNEMVAAVTDGLINLSKIAGQADYICVSNRGVIRIIRSGDRLMSGMVIVLPAAQIRNMDRDDLFAWVQELF